MTYRRLCRLIDVDVDEDFDALVWRRVGDDLATAISEWRGSHPTVFVRVLAGDEAERAALQQRLGDAVANYRLIVEEANKIEESGRGLGLLAEMRALHGRGR